MSENPTTAAGAPPAITASSIETERLVKAFGSRTVVDGVSLRFSAG